MFSTFKVKAPPASGPIPELSLVAVFWFFAHGQSAVPFQGIACLLLFGPLFLLCVTLKSNGCEQKVRHRFLIVHDLDLTNVSSTSTVGRRAVSLMDSLLEQLLPIQCCQWDACMNTLSA
jgi:hypothetical protein